MSSVDHKVGKEIYPLFGFTNGEVIVITRGPTQDHAFDYACRSKNFRRGTTIFAMNHLPINSAEKYEVNHDPGWLHRPPVYLEKLNASQ